jgi:outer membrane protein assembly factor BamB
VFRRHLVLAMTALTAGLLSGCGTDDTWVQAQAAASWSAQYGDASNSSYTAVDGADALTFGWSRSVKGELGAEAAVGDGSYLAVNGQTAGGCSLMVWETANDARQRWCTRLVQGGGFASPLIDGFDNVYVGQPGTMLSYPLTQWVRWRKPVIGMPTTPRFLADGQLLVVTHLGQVVVFDAHRGSVDGTPLDLVEGIDPTDSGRGLADCPAARAGCPVASAPAFASATGLVVLGLWQPGAPAPQLVGLRYRPGQTPLLSREWVSDAVGEGPIGSPVASADGATIYVNGRDRKLWAVNAADGTPKWSVPLTYLPQTPPSVSPDGLIVTGGGPDSQLVAVRDHGDRGEVVWSRPDVAPSTTASRAGGLGYTVVAEGRGQTLVVFRASDGQTLQQYPLPEAQGAPVGVSVSHDRRVLVTTSAGQVYAFEPT